MNISIVAGALLLCALPALAQPDLKPVNGLPYPLVTPEDAARLTLADKPFSLHLRDVTLSDALNELEKQSGVAFDVSSGGDEALGRKLSLDLETRSFFNAIKVLLDKAGVNARFRRFSGGGEWHLMFGERDESSGKPQSGTSLFPIYLLNLNSSSQKKVTPWKLEDPVREQSDALSVVVRAIPEPHLSLVGAPHIRVTRAEDETGHSLRFEDTQSSFDFDDGAGEEIQVPLRVSKTSSRRLSIFEGVAIYVLPTKRDTWEVSDVRNAKGIQHVFQSAGQTLTVSVEEVKKIATGVEINIKIRLSKGLSFVELQNPLLSFGQIESSLHLWDADGQTWSSGSYGGRVGNNELELTTQFSPKYRSHPALRNGEAEAGPPDSPLWSKPFKLVLNLPTEFVQTEVPFSFSDLPLP